MKYFFNLVFFTCMFLFIIVSKVFPVAITDIRLTPLGIIRIDCGDWQQVTIAIDYHLRPMEPLPQTGWIEIWENDKNIINGMKAQGYKVLVVWESELKDELEKITKKILKFAKS